MLRSFIFLHKIRIVVLCEPRISGSKADRIIRRIGLPYSHRVEAQGFSGGIWFLWSHEVHVDIIHSDWQFIHTRVQLIKENKSFLFTAVYASPTTTIRNTLWLQLSNLASSITEPWSIAGDFNAVLASHERRSSTGTVRGGDKPFQHFVNANGLIDMGFSGPRYTWRRGLSFARLDRILTNETWATHFPLSSAQHLPRVKSDHTPLKLLMGLASGNSTAPPPFRFLAAWLTHPDFGDLVKNTWQHDTSLQENIRRFSESARKWNHETFGHIGVRKRRLEARIMGIQKTLESHPLSHSLTKLEGELRQELEQTCLQEELLWLQKSRSEWINSGDRNTAFYHTKAKIRRARSRITTLKDEQGSWISDESSLQQHACQYYQNLYTAEPRPTSPYPHRGMFPPIPPSSLAALNATVSLEEVKRALFDMQPLKAPGKDGIHALFYQSQWDVVGSSLHRLVQKVMDGEPMEEGLNNTVIALIPKVPQPTTIKEFRPISLCSVVYKLVTKILSSRIKHLMPLLILPYQSSFIQGRSITDNIIIAQEVIHSMKKKTGKKGWLAIKVDLEKAFDKLSWAFIQDTLEDVGFPPTIINLIMHCITTPTMQLLWNGQPSPTFKPSRGVRQGDPISPYIFVLCMERLSQAIAKAVSNDRWETIKLGRRGPPLSHLFFADDLVLFGSTTQRQLQLIEDILAEFCAASGQVVNLSKTRIYLSRNILREDASRICRQLRFQRTDCLGKYLGVPLLHSRVTADTYKYLVERTQSKLASWKAKSLSLAGRITLAKSVLNAIPFYAMQTSSLPASTLRALDRITRRFVWGSCSNTNKPSLIKWEEVCQPPSRGGCGLKNLEGQNHAFLAKLAYQLISNQNILWVAVLRAKYNWSPASCYAFRTKTASHTWRSIAKVWADSELNFLWRIGDGATIRFWSDPWLRDTGPLKLLSFADIPADELNRPLKDFMDNNGDWNWSLFRHLLPTNLLSQIALSQSSTTVDEPDTCTWSLNTNGAFSVSSAYQAKLEDAWNDHDVIWEWIWKWPGIQRVRSFLWLAVKAKLLTNAERCKRGMATTASCVLCNSEVEDLDHILRKCPTAQLCWKKILPPNRHVEFFDKPFKSWLLWNLNPQCMGVQWRLFFGTLIWRLWDNRNKNIFLNESLSAENIIISVSHQVHHTASSCNLPLTFDGPT